MKYLWIIPAVPAGLFLLWLLLIRGKRRKSGFYGLAGFDYAHRGLHDRAKGIPENSLAAFRRAVEAGYGAELDVHLTKDGGLVVMHDESLVRTAGQDVRICDLTIDKLARYRLEGTQEKIPELHEVLTLFVGKAPLIIELKTCEANYAELTARTCRCLDDFPELTYCIESFDPRVLWWLRKNRPQVIRGQLSCNLRHEKIGIPKPLLWAMTYLLGNVMTVPHFIAYNYEARGNVSLRLCRNLWGVQEVSWTLRSRFDVSNAKNKGCIAIFENCRP